MTAERVALGKKLYFDTRLSADGTVACATCHDVSRGFTDQRAGVGGHPRPARPAQRADDAERGAAPDAVLDGRAPIARGAGQAADPQPDRDGPARRRRGGRRRSPTIPEYQQRFQRGLRPRRRTTTTSARAIAAFERTLVFLDSPFDRFLRRRRRTRSPTRRKRGWVLFNGKARCVALPSDQPVQPARHRQPLPQHRRRGARHQNFEAPGAAGADGAATRTRRSTSLDELALDDRPERARALHGHARTAADIGAFRTPQLRNVGITAPYMHDGSMQTLWDVMDHYNKGGEANRFLDGGIEPLALTEEEIDAARRVPVHADRRALRRRRTAAIVRAAARPRRDGAALPRRRRSPCARRCPSSSASPASRSERRQSHATTSKFKSVETKLQRGARASCSAAARTSTAAASSRCRRAAAAAVAAKGLASSALVPAGRRGRTRPPATVSGLPLRLHLRLAPVRAASVNDRFVRSLLRAVDDVNALDPQPDFVLYGGDLAQLGQPDELELGAQILKS